jgi:exodeoxyribonuclease VII small subunit
MGKPARSTPPQSFESALAELETLVATLEAGQLPLEQSIEAYRRGTELMRFCRLALADAQQQVRVLTEANVLEPFAPEGE